MAIGVGFGTIVIIVILVIMMSFRVLREYQRAVVFMLGRFWKVKGPGFFLLIPVIQQMVRIDLRTVVMDVPPQDVITRDNVSVKVGAVVLPHPRPGQGGDQVENYYRRPASWRRRPCARCSASTSSTSFYRRAAQLDIQQVLDSQTEAWGHQRYRRSNEGRRPERTMIRAIAPGRGRARGAPRSSMPKAVRRRKIAAGGADALEAAAGDAASLLADPGQYRRRQELDDRLPAADRPVERYASKRTESPAP
jgi:hypothetical protein